MLSTMLTAPDVFGRLNPALTYLSLQVVPRRLVDAVVLASPVYFGDVTAQLKSYIDRTYSFLTSDYRTSSTPSRLAPTKLVFVLTQGNPDEKNFADVFQRYEMFMKWMNFTQPQLVRACGLGPENTPPEKAMLQAEAVARELMA